MKLLRLVIVLIAVIMALGTVTAPAYAYINPPSGTPLVINKYCYRNVLEEDDLLIIIYETTPYTTTPSIDYSEAFVWRLIDTDNVTELGQALGYDYDENGYGYNVISFYFSADDAPAWGRNYSLTLSGVPSAFETPPEYTYQIYASDYSGITETAAVKVQIASTILLLAADLDSKWGLTSTTSLLLEIETGTVLSIYGEAFFRGAIYGIQAMAPNAFRLVVSNIEALTDREWGTGFSSNLTGQHAGTPIETALEAGESFLNVNYNLMGILGTLAVCALLLFGNWYLAGGNAWRGLIEAASPLVICTRMGLWGMGELGLIAAAGWLYVSGKIWKIF